MINPTIVEGQVLGGIAQGLGGAMYERIEYDREGNPLNANFVDFLVPYATEVPHVEVLHLETPSPLNPLGVKGVGEAGCIAVGAVIASGIEDALAPLGAGKFRADADHAEHDPRRARGALTRRSRRAGVARFVQALACVRQMEAWAGKDARAVGSE